MTVEPIHDIVRAHYAAAVATQRRRPVPVARHAGDCAELHTPPTSGELPEAAALASAGLW